MIQSLPGLLLALVVGLNARLLHGFLPPAAASALGEVVIAMALGLLLGNLVRLPARFAPGLKASVQTVLRLAIVLLGARLTVQQALAIGGKALLLIVALMTVALLLARGMARLLGVSDKLAALIGVGTAVCGNSAISATAPVIGAKDEDVSFAIATNTFFGTVAVLVYPLLGRAFGLDAASFGLWAGTAVNDTSQVVAAGFAFGEEAGRVATAVKLTRNALMGAVIVLMGFLYAERGAGAARVSVLTRLRQSVPSFVLGFLAMTLLASVGAFRELSTLTGFDVAKALGEAAKLLILVALAAVGLSTRFDAMRRTGLKPFYLGLAVATVVSATSLLLVRWLHPGI